MISFIKRQYHSFMTGVRLSKTLSGWFVSTKRVEVLTANKAATGQFVSVFEIDNIPYVPYFCFANPDVNRIFLSDQVMNALDFVKQFFVYHEMGHCLYHKDMNLSLYERDIQIEHEADMYACSILGKEEVLRAINFLIDDISSGNSLIKDDICAELIIRRDYLINQ